MILTLSFKHVILWEIFNLLGEQKLQSQEVVINYKICEFVFLN